MTHVSQIAPSLLVISTTGESSLTGDSSADYTVNFYKSIFSKQFCVTSKTRVYQLFSTLTAVKDPVDNDPEEVASQVSSVDWGDAPDINEFINCKGFSRDQVR